jgi:DNA-binding HxlR family transcriptional regulator
MQVVMIQSWMMKPYEDALPVVDYRSCCPVAICLDILGDKWTLLIIRDLILGQSRFKDLLASPERIASNTLTDRLNRLRAHQIVELMPSADGTKYQAYRLTDKGKDLLPILKAMRHWGLTWIPEANDQLSPP